MDGVFRSRRRVALLALALALLGAAAGGALVALLGGHGRSKQAATRSAPRARPVGPTLFVRPKPRPVQPGAPGAGVGSESNAAPEYASGQLLVKFKDDTSSETANRVLDRADANVEQNLKRIDVKVVDVPAARAGQSLAALDSSPAVDYVERDVVVDAFDTKPNDSLWADQWGPALIKAPKAWDSTKGSPNVVVAVVDTGVDFQHPDLAGAFTPGYDFVNNDSDPSDDDGHGTATAGVIAARTNNVEGQAGICWKCSVMPVKVLDATGSGSTSSVAAGIVWAVDHGARVINLSLGSSATTQTLTDAVSYAASRGVILVAAAGNAGSTAFSYPAADPKVISVAGTTTSDSLYSWSNYGPWVQVAAPGCNAGPGLQGGYVNFCGTSSATPLVSGLAALALSAKPGASMVEVEHAIRSTARPLSGSPVEYGLVDAQAALSALGATAPAPVAAPALTPTTAPVPTSALTGSAPTQDQPRRLFATFRGTLLGLAPVRFTRAVTAGKLNAQLTFMGSRTLRLTIVGPHGKTVGRISGRSPLRVARVVRAGTYRFVVKGHRARAPFVLRISSLAA